MILTISINYSLNNKINKDISAVYETDDFVFKEPTSILFPVIIVNFGNTDFNNLEFLKCNYCDIVYGPSPNTRKNYFIKDKVIISNDIVEMHLEEDVLSTFSWLLNTNSENFIFDRSGATKMKELLPGDLITNVNTGFRQDIVEEEIFSNNKVTMVLAVTGGETG